MCRVPCAVPASVSQPTEDNFSSSVGLRFVWVFFGFEKGIHSFLRVGMDRYVATADWCACGSDTDFWRLWLGMLLPSCSSSLLFFLSARALVAVPTAVAIPFSLPPVCHLSWNGLRKPAAAGTVTTLKRFRLITLPSVPYFTPTKYRRVGGGWPFSLSPVNHRGHPWRLERELDVVGLAG